MFNTYEDKIDVNRPTDRPEIIPISLLHEAFGTFLDDYQTHEPTAQENQWLRELQEKMLKVYQNETDRADVFRNLLSAGPCGLQIEAAAVRDTMHHTDGHLHLENHPLLITEAKNEWTRLASVPHLEAFAYYIEFVKGEEPLAFSFTMLVGIVTFQ